MHKNLSILIQMQDCDDKITELRALMEKLPRQLNNLKENVKTAEEKLQENKQLIDDNKKEENRLELIIKSNKEQIGRYQNQLLTIETNKEYKALNKEVSHLEQTNTELEDKIVILMEEAEELLETKKEIEIELKKANDELSLNEKKLEDEIAEVKKEEEEYRARRMEFAKELPVSLVKKYAALIKNRNAKAVVFNVGEACGGCGFKIRPQVMVDLHEGEKIIFCESCSRFLVYNIEE